MKASLKKIRSAWGIDEYRLNNGLRLLYRRETAAPVIAVCVTYHVGSRNEAAGHTGSTHILEHLLFKDTPKFNKAQGTSLTELMEFAGADWNATTWLDRTNYFEMVPDDKLALALEIEADRMRYSQFSDKDLAVEMTVVRNEYERGRNSPFELLNEAVWEKSFTKHPYRIPTIGTKADIEASTATKLREFYDTFYWPNNATLMVVGNAPFSKVKKLVLRYFGPLKHSPHTIPQLRVAEPRQNKPRSVRMQKQMGVSIVEMQYKICRARDKDYPALMVAATVLGGGFSSRLQRGLVDVGLAADASAYALALFDPGILNLSAHVADGASASQVLVAMRAIVRRLAQSGITQDELSYAKERILSQSSVERDGAFRQVRTVSEATSAGNWRLAFSLDAAVKDISAAAVNRAVKKYLLPAGETSGVLVNNA